MSKYFSGFTEIYEMGVMRMKKEFLASIISNRKVVLFSLFMIILLGIHSYNAIPKQEYPDVNAPAAMITIVYPGASTEDMEEQVAKKVEEKLLELKWYKYSNSFSQNSGAAIILVLDLEANQYEIDKSWEELRRKLDALKPELPDGVLDIDINTNLVDTAGMMIGVSGENYSYEELVDYGEAFKDQLINIDGVQKFEIVGEQETEVRVTVDHQELNRYPFSLDDIVRVLQMQNLSVPLGALENKNMDMNVRSCKGLVSIEDIEKMVLDVSSESGSIVRLKDVASVTKTVGDSNYMIKHNGRNGILLVGYFKESQNVVDVGENVRDVLDRVKANMPEDLEISELTFEPEEVDKSITDFTMSLLQGIVIVIAVVIAGMGLRNAMVVSFAIPLSILITFSAMYLNGLKLQLYSLAGLVMALGMLVDNAIVVSDSIQLHIDSGVDKLRACVEGTKEVAIPVLSSTLTTVAAFGTFLFMPRATQQILGAMTKAIIFALTASYGVALLVTPVMAYLFFEKTKQRVIKQSKVKGSFNTVLTWALRHQWKTVAIAVVVFMAIMTLAQLLPVEFYPTSFKSMIYIDVKTEYASDISKTEDIVVAISQVLDEQPEITDHLAAIGGGLPKFDMSIMPQGNSRDVAQFMVKLDLEAGRRFKTNEEMVNYLQKELEPIAAGASILVKELEIAAVGSPVQARVITDDEQKLKEASKMVKDLLYNIEGTTHVVDDMESNQYEFIVDTDLLDSSTKGIMHYDIQNQLNIALMGRKATTVKMNSEEYDVVVKSNLETQKDIEQMQIKSSFMGHKVPLKNMANVNLIPQVSTIYHYDGQKAVSIGCDVLPGYNAIAVQTEWEEKIKELDLQGVLIKFEGEKQNASDEMGNIGVAAIGAAFIIYMILMVQFNSLLQPVIITLSVPFALVGSILGLFVLRQPLSFFGSMGIVSLIGVVVNNAIILIDYINHERAKGKTIEEACKSSVNQRFRPVMLSSTTTVLGLIPLALNDNDLFTPMAVAFMGGLLVSTVLTLVVVPVMYSLLNRLNSKVIARIKAIGDKRKKWSMETESA